MGTLATVTRYLRRVAGYAVETAPLKTSAGAADAGNEFQLLMMMACWIILLSMLL